MCLLQALTSRVSLRRLSPTLSKKASIKTSLASLEGTETDEGASAACETANTFPARAQRSLKRSTESFKIAALKLTDAVKPTCFGTK